MAPAELASNNGSAVTSTNTDWRWATSYIITDPTGGRGEIEWSMTKEKGQLHPNLYFKYIKSKFNILQKNSIDKRLEELERAFTQAVEAGQDVLAQKFLDAFNLETKQTMLIALGFTTYIEREVLDKYKHKIRGGHISNTMLKDFTRVIPDKVLKKKKKVEGVFDDYEIFHYWNPEAKDVKKMDPKEKEKMKDPVLFGLIKGSSRLYYIADWEDEYCDLSFNDMIKVLGKVKNKIHKTPSLDV